MRKLLTTLGAALLFAGVLNAQNVTPEFLREEGGGHWGIIDVAVQDGNFTISTNQDEGNVWIEKIDGRYFLLSAVDSLFINGPHNFKIDLPPESGLSLHNKEQASFRRPTSQTSMTIPRPFVINYKEQEERASWMFNLVKPNGTLERITILRHWPYAPPAITFIFEQKDNPTLKKDSILTVPCDSTIYFSSRQDLVLSKMSIEKVQEGMFIRLDNVVIDDHPLPVILYKGPGLRADVDGDFFSSRYYGETKDIGQNLNSIKSIKVVYSYLDDSLKTVKVQSTHSIQQFPNESHGTKHFNILSVLSCILLGLLLLLAVSLVFIAPARSRITVSEKKEISNISTTVIPPVKEKNADFVKREDKKAPASGEKDDIAQGINRLLSTIKRVLGLKKDNETYSQFIERRGGELVAIESASVEIFGKPKNGESYQSFFRSIKDRALQLDKMIRQYLGPRPDNMPYREFFQKIHNESELDKKALNQIHNTIIQTLGTPADGQDYSVFLTQRVKELNALPRILQTYFGLPKPGDSYESIIKARTERLSALENLDRTVKDIFGQPNTGESSTALLSRCTQSLKERLEREVQGTQQKLDAQRQQLESEHTNAINDLMETLQRVRDIKEVDMKLYCSSQLSILGRMRSSYNNCSKYITSGSPFGEYAKRIGISLMSFVELAESIYDKAEEQDCVTSISELLAPVIQKALNDHTSWLNALTRLEAYARTEVLRKQMLRDGIQLSALTNLFYAVQEFLYNNQYVLNPLPELFVNPDNLDDYNCDNMDIVISNLFDYEDEVQNNAIVDVIKIGYSCKNEPSIKTTVAYYSKPEA